MERVLYWFPRILGILAVLFMMVFSMDCFEGPAPLSDKLGCFVMHNIPAMVLAILLILAWNFELIGGVLFVLIAVVMTIVFKGFTTNPGIIGVTVPFMFTGALFVLHDRYYRKPAKKEEITGE